MRILLCALLLMLGGCFASPFKQTLYNNSGRDVTVDYNGQTYSVPDRSSVKTQDTLDTLEKWPQFAVTDGGREWRFDKSIGYVGCEWPPMGSCQKLQFEPDGRTGWVGGDSPHYGAYTEPPPWQPPAFPQRGR